MAAAEYDVGLNDEDGDPVYLTPGTTGWYTQANHSWYNESFFSTTVQADITSAWYSATANHQPDAVSADVGGNTYTLDDRPAPIAARYPGASSLTGAPYQEADWLDISQDSVNVHKPDGVARPSLWVGSGGLTVTAQTDSTVTFTIASTATTPTLTRTYTTRYWTQMDRLASRNPDSTLAFDGDWPIKLKANLDASSVPAHDPLLAALTADEDITNWDNFSYLKFKFNAASDGPGLTVALTYYELLDVFDPCYTSHDARYGQNGEFEYVRSDAKTATYTTDYLGAPLDGAGIRTYYIDLRCPAEGELNRGALQHVSAITVTGFPIPAAGTDTWTLDGSALELRDGPVGSQHLALDYKRSWNWPQNWFGFAGWHDGAPILAVKYGYEQFEGVERGLKYVQYQQHDPGTDSDTDLSYAKPLSRLADELNWQEGFTVTCDTSALEALLEDEDGNAMFSVSDAAWWWLKYAPDGEPPFDVAPTVRSVTIARGAPTQIDIYHYVDAKAHGLVRTGGVRERMTGTAVLKSRAQSTGAVATVGTYTSDEHGRWVSDPIYADDSYNYYVDGGEDLGYATTRSWSSADAYGNSGPGLAMTEANGGQVFKAYHKGRNVYCERRPTLYDAWETRRFVSEGRNPGIAAALDGVVRIVVELAGQIIGKFSRDGGKTWQ